MRRAGIAIGILVGTVFGREARAREIGVCVDVRLQRAVDKPEPSAETKPLAAAPANAPTKAPAEASKDSSSDASTPPELPPPPDAAAAGATPPAPRVDIAAAESAASVDPVGSRDPRVLSGAHLPLGQTPETYLARLLEHFVTHERGYVAVKQGCEQRIVVDLYPLRLGWTVFASYTGTGREERVDQLLPTELSQFAERSVLALLHDVSIHDTVDRNNVLWADSLESTQTIRGHGHAVVTVGGRLRAGMFRTVNGDGSDVVTKLRPFTPVLIGLGYRGQFESFGVEAAAEVDINRSETAVRKNPTGGHVDYGGSTGLTLHALRYANPRGLGSLYFGGGATFALHWFSVIKPAEERENDDHSTLWSGGLDVDGIIGYEFMRASAVSFYLQGELNLPAYAVRNENNAGSVNTWFPGAALKIGTIF